MTSIDGNPTVQEGPTEESLLSGSDLKKQKHETSSFHEQSDLKKQKHETSSFHEQSVKIDDENEMAFKMGDLKEQEKPFEEPLVYDSVLDEPKDVRMAEEDAADESKETDKDSVSSGSAFDDSSPCHSDDDKCSVHNYCKGKATKFDEDYEDRNEIKRCVRYEKQLHKSENFFLDSRLIPKGIIGGTYPLNLDVLSDETHSTGRSVKEAIQYAIDEYNKKEGTNLQLERIIHVNIQANFDYYITFLGKVDPSQKKPDTYQAKVSNYTYRRGEGRNIFHFLRREPKNYDLLKRLQGWGYFKDY